MVSAINAINANTQATGFGDVLQFAGQSDILPPPAGCPESALIGDQFIAPIVIYKSTGGLPPGVIALTTFCTQDAVGNALPAKVAGKMELNYGEYFTTELLPDIQSILTHELLHLMGLRHSCEPGSEASGIPSCEGADFSYIEAMMYPTFDFPDGAHGEVKHNLMPNDQGRLNCIYL